MNFMRIVRELSSKAQWILILVFQLNFLRLGYRTHFEMAKVSLNQFELMRKILEIAGIWQLEIPSRSVKVRRFVSVLLFLSVTFVLPLINLLYFDKKVEEIGSYVLLYVGPNLKIAILIIQMANFRKVFEDLDELLVFTEFDKNIHRIDLRKHIKSTARIFKTFIGLLLVFDIMDMSIGLFEHHLPYETWIPYNHRVTADYLHPLIMVQTVLSIFTESIAISLEMMPAFLMGVASALLAELSDRMKLLSENPTDDETDYEELKQCVHVHQRIGQFVAYLEEQFSVWLLVQGFLSAGFFCLLVYHLSTVRNLCFLTSI
jgi:hypothetical protein